MRIPYILLNLVAQKIAEVSDYPWEFMSEQGRSTMREHAEKIIKIILETDLQDAWKYKV